jgi:hypothetical protein
VLAFKQPPDGGAVADVLAGVGEREAGGVHPARQPGR